jgi:hypothetical protein
MKLSQLISISLTVAGGAAALKVLGRRQRWEKSHTAAAICVDFEDLSAAAIRAGLTLDDLAQQARHAGATHVSLPEMTLNGLLTQGRLAPRGPVQPVDLPAPVGHWNYLYGASDLVQILAAELEERLPHLDAQVLDDGSLAFAGDLETIGQLGLGFERRLAERLLNAGLSLIPRPVSYDWPDPKMVRRTIDQSAELGRWLAFAGQMVLGHEMHLDATLDAMEAHDLGMVYFAETRHQRGDWFIAKRRAPNIVLAHVLTREEMLGLDYHAASHNWAHFIQERGIRLCYLNFFRELHATEPLEGLAYISQVRSALEAEGMVLSADPKPALPIPTPAPQELGQIGLATAGIAAAALTQTLKLPEVLAIPATVLGAAAALKLPGLESSRQPSAHSHEHHEHEPDHHHHDHDQAGSAYATSYAPKLLALGTASLAPVITAGLAGSSQPKSTWLANLIFQASAAASLAALTSGQDYHLRIEDYRGMNLDWFLPMSVAALQLPGVALKALALAGLTGAWAVSSSRGLDPLGLVDPGYAEGHTHHISAAQRIIGDFIMAAGPRPARKWAGLGPLAGAAAAGLNPSLAAPAGLLAAAGSLMGLVGFRRPERALEITLKEALPSYAVGAALGAVVLAAGGRKR